MLSTALKCKGGYGQKAHAWSAARGGCCILSPAKGWASGSSRTSGLGFLTHRRAFPPHQGLLRKTEEIRHGDSCVWRGNPEGGEQAEVPALDSCWVSVSVKVAQSAESSAVPCSLLQEGDAVYLRHPGRVSLARGSAVASAAGDLTFS